MTYIWPRPSTRTPAPGVMKFYKSDLCLGVEKKIFKEIMHFLLYDL